MWRFSAATTDTHGIRLLHCQSQSTSNHLYVKRFVSSATWKERRGSSDAIENPDEFPARRTRLTDYLSVFVQSHQGEDRKAVNHVEQMYLSKCFIKSSMEKMGLYDLP